MRVKTTRILKNFLDAENLKAGELCTRFANWKSSADEYSHYFFGKDSAYFRPTVAEEKYILRHVHIVPILDKAQLSKWNRSFQLGKRKTSDRVLVYASDNKGNFLLIMILSEPNAHLIATMQEEKHKQIMAFFAEIAEAFIFDGSVIA